ncbi:RNA polymerase sigma factor [Streptomyces sp. NPDC050982]|uniref:RNA polymerase sigma factor n=1 Tax=Streptomyces sp. NPDC050982 TaxID=3154746 RepID=UPI0033D7A564
MRARIRAGDPEAFTELFTAHARAVHSHAARLTADRTTAEDVVSLTFLEAWRLRERLRPDAGPQEEDAPADPDPPGGDGLRPWLYGIATNVLRNTRRTARRHGAALGRLHGLTADRESVPDFADELVVRMEDAERVAAARAALKRLRRSEREVFALCVWSELSYAAAGEALGVPASTVRSRLSRARQRLRRLAEAELARGPVPRTDRSVSKGDPPGPVGDGYLPEPAGGPERNPGRPPRTGQVPSSRPEAARSTQEKYR